MLIYCTKAKPTIEWYWEKGKKEVYELCYGKRNYNYCLNGKIVAECEVECEEISNYGFARHSEMMMKELLNKSCLTMEELNRYAPHKEYKENDYIYALHISNLKVFDEPLKLSELQRHNACKECPFDAPYACYSDNCKLYSSVRKAPENMMYVYLNDIQYCLISIRPEWICKILNGEKTIEVRKKIMKGMYEETL